MYNSIKKINNNYINVDETSIELNSKPNKGYSLKGKPCIVQKINKRKRYSLITSINNNRVTNFKIVDGSVNGEIFKEFIEEIHKRHRKTILMDNAKIHHYKNLKKYVERNKIDIIYNVPYCPEYAPIEYYHNTMKNKIYQMDINSLEELKRAVSDINNELNRKGFHNYYEKTFNNLENSINIM